MDTATLLPLAGLAALALIAIVIAIVEFRAHARVRRERDTAAATLAEERGMRASAELALARAEERASQLAELGEKLAAQTAAREAAEQSVAAMQAQIRERERAVAEERASLSKMGEEIRVKFTALAGEVLDQSQKKFLERAGETFKVSQEKTEGGVKSVVEPVQKGLEEFRAQLAIIEKERHAHKGELDNQIKQLSEGLSVQHKETSKLVNALQRSSTTRGQWGERTVENILELAGLSANIDYEAQHQTRDSDGNAMRPDFVVRLPGGGRFVVDSKVALTGYLDAVEAEDDTARKSALQRHAAQVRTHVKQLSKKEYANAVDGAIDFVALFIPGESFYSAAMDQDPALFDDAIAKGIIIVTPATLLALAKAVSFGWRQQALEANAEKIAALGAELYSRLSTFSEYLGRVGSGLKSATSNYNKAVASLETRVLVSARRMSEMNGSTQTKTIDAPDQVDEAPRALASPDAAD
ncbi:DNA recombination protein RmuC [Maricaulis sp.]|uniref:DNA recombination protein RmuC n=1 Tax=Maricaulis sp. TaxID=1486257 RepID=UPI003A8E8CD1